MLGGGVLGLGGTIGSSIKDAMTKVEANKGNMEAVALKNQFDKWLMFGLIGVVAFLVIDFILN